MLDSKKYFYLKLKDNFFTTEEVRLLESMPKGIYYSNLLIKLYLLALKYDGALKLNDSVYYDEKMLASVTNLSLRIVKEGLKALEDLGFLERFADGTTYMSDIQSFVGKSNSEAERKKLYRDKLLEEKQLFDKLEGQLAEQMSQECPDIDGTNHGTNSEKCPLENRDIENRDIELRGLENREKEEINSLSVSLLKDFEARTGAVGSLNLAALKKAVELHGSDNVKLAIDKALEKNKPTMTYINGILKNWAVEGYPKEEDRNGNGGVGKNIAAGSGEFSGFKPKEPRSLSEGERAELEGELV